MAPSEAILDLRLAIQQPVHRRVQIVLVRVGDPELIGQRRLAERADRRELRRRRDRALADIANASSRSRDGERSSSLASSSRPLIANAAFTCPAGNDRSTSNASETTPTGSPRNPARTSSTSSSGRCEMFPTVSFLTLPPSR